MRIFTIVGILLFFITPASAQHVQFQDYFKRVVLGSEWRPATGSWRIEDSVLSIDSRNYDELLTSLCYAYATQPYSIQVELQGMRAGLFFGIDDFGTKRLSQMIRFDEKSILAGYFDGGGEFTATSVFDSQVAPVDWTSLRVDVDPMKHRYAVFVNGRRIGIDSTLVFRSGFIGLEASDGPCKFRSIRVSASLPFQPPRSPKPGTLIDLSHISSVTCEKNNVTVYMPELGEYVTLDSQGRVLKSTGAVRAPELRRTLTINSRTFSIDSRRILIKDLRGHLVDSISSRLVSPACLATDGSNVFVSDPGARMIFRSSADGTLLETIDGSILGGFKAPKGIVFNGNNELVIADYDRIVFWDEKAAAEPKIEMMTGGRSCRVVWQSNSRLATSVQVGADGKPMLTVRTRAGSPRTKRDVVLHDLTPLTRYTYRVSPVVRTIPESVSVSKILRFTTSPSDPSMMSYTRLPVLCMVYRTVSIRDKYPRSVFPKLPDGRTLTEEDLAYLRHATEFNREFYFRNSGCKIVLDFDFFVVEDTLWLHEVGDTDPYWLSPNDRVTRDFERAARHFGKVPQYYAGLVCPYAWVNYPPRRTSALRDPSKTDTINIRQAVGGGTYGVPAPWKYGSTAGYTSNPFQDRFSRQDWLITHEFHHQIDALMDVSGFPGYYHADQPWKMPGKFGEDFDFNAHIMRNAPRGWWLALKFGTLSETIDADHDGVPDDDPSLPFDEKRLHGNPRSADTDGDGVSDLAEVMMGSEHGSALDNRDTDGDGLDDREDPEPLYAVQPGIPRIRSLGELGASTFGSVHSSNLVARFSLAWMDSTLLLAYETDKPANLLWQIDAEDDGWFHGFDNFQIRILNNGDSVRTADYYLRDCSSWTESPQDRRDILRRSDLGVESSVSSSPTKPDKNTYRLVVRVPRNDKYGLTLKPGKAFRIRLGLQTTTDLWVWDELFERNYMMQVVLQ